MVDVTNYSPDLSCKMAMKIICLRTITIRIWKRIISAADGKARRINVIMPFYTREDSINVPKESLLTVL